jgi:hypothetical protein
MMFDVIDDTLVVGDAPANVVCSTGFVRTMLDVIDDTLVVGDASANVV